MRANHWLRALLALCVGLSVYGLATLAQAAVLRATAAVFGWLLQLLGEANRVSDNLVVGEDVRFLVVAECTAVVPIAILVGAMAASPASGRKRLLGASYGALVLALLNQIRLLSLWFLEKSAPEHFDWVHVALWQPAMVVAVVAIWIVWLSRLGLGLGAGGPGTTSPHATEPAAAGTAGPANTTRGSKTTLR